MQTEIGCRHDTLSEKVSCLGLHHGVSHPQYTDGQVGKGAHFAMSFLLTVVRKLAKHLLLHRNVVPKKNISCTIALLSVSMSNT